MIAIDQERTIDLIPRLSPEFRSPYHLDDWCALLDRAATGEALRAICAEPIRHYKSRTTWHGVIKILLANPSCPVVYLTHSHQKAQDTGKAIRDLARSCDKQFGTHIGPDRGHDTIDHWSNPSGGGVLVMSADQSRLGYDCGCLIADDPIDEFGAYEQRVRDAVDDTIAHYTARCMWKGKAGPVLIVASPWHPDDPIGRRKTRLARVWLYLSHPAIIDEGMATERAFAEDVWPLHELKAMREELKEKDPTERIWMAQLMCNPIPPGGGKFGPPSRYVTLPDIPFRIGYGCDFAFTKNPASDWFALCAARIYGKKAYLLEVKRHKVDAHEIESSLKATMNKYGRGVFWSYQSGPEVGLSDILIEHGVPIGKMPARYNKLVRAARTSKRWNDGDVLVPVDDQAPWAPGFIKRAGLFRGFDGDEDDEIDCVVSMCDGAIGGFAAPPSSSGKPSYSGL